MRIQLPIEIAFPCLWIFDKNDANMQHASLVIIYLSSLSLGSYRWQSIALLRLKKEFCGSFERFILDLGGAHDCSVISHKLIATIINIIIYITKPPTANMKLLSAISTLLLLNEATSQAVSCPNSIDLGAWTEVELEDELLFKYAVVLSPSPEQSIMCARLESTLESYIGFGISLDGTFL